MGVCSGVGGWGQGWYDEIKRQNARQIAVSDKDRLTALAARYYDPFPWLTLSGPAPDREQDSFDVDDYPFWGS